MTPKTGLAAAAVEACKRAGGSIRTTVSTAYDSSKSTVRDNVDELRESAIVPLPQVERLPVDLRKLDWKDKPSGPVDAASIVRKLYGPDLTPHHENELGCAYALLAWELSLDEYWILAIEKLQSAQKGSDDEASKLAKANLEHVTEVSGFPHNP